MTNFVLAVNATSGMICQMNTCCYIQVSMYIRRRNDVSEMILSCVVNISVRSIVNKSLELQHFIYTYVPNITTISET